MIHKVKSKYMAHMIRRHIRYIYHDEYSGRLNRLFKIFRFINNREEEKNNDEIQIVYDMDNCYYITCGNIDITNTALQVVSNIYKDDINYIRSLYKSYKIIENR